MSATWVLVAIGVLLAVHLALMVLAIRRAGGHPATPFDPGTLLDGSEKVAEESPDTGAANHRTGTVQCRECGTTNKAGFRYCRACVSEFPTGVSRVTADSGGESRRTI